jgi:hypothetical protein
VQPTDPMTQSLADLIEHGPDAAMRGPDTTEPMVVKSMRLPLRLADALEREAAERGIGGTVLMRELLEDQVDVRRRRRGDDGDVDLQIRMEQSDPSSLPQPG